MGVMVFFNDFKQSKISEKVEYVVLCVEKIFAAYECLIQFDETKIINSTTQRYGNGFMSYSMAIPYSDSWGAAREDQPWSLSFQGTIFVALK